MNEDSLIAELRVRNLERRDAVQVAARRALPIRPPASLADLQRVEQELNLRVPSFFSRVYLEVADGNFGPGYGLFPLTGATLSLVSETRDKRDLVPDSGDPWHEDLICVCTFGCTFYAGVDCRGDRGAVYLFEEHHGLVKEPEALSLAEWLIAWLEGHLNPFGRILSGPAA